MMLRIEAGDRSKRCDLNSVREETGFPVSTWTRMISFRIARLRVSRLLISLGLALLRPECQGQGIGPAGNSQEIDWPAMSDGAAVERLVLVGPGRAGLALARSWRSAGGRTVLVVRNESRAEEVRGAIGDPAVEVRSQDDGRDLAGDILVLAVPDDAI